MNSLLVGIGQAGTTLTSIISSMLFAKAEQFVNPNATSCKAFLMDSEKKVIDTFIKSSLISKYFSKHTNIITNSSGRGNNWALGHSMNYKEFKTEKNINQDSYDHLTSFIEKCDFINKIFFLHSLNGGTGSGCGTRMIEMLKDEFDSKIKIFSVPIFGFNIENTTLSQFNTYLTIGTIYDEVDLIFKVENEKFVKDFSFSNKIFSELLSDFILKSEKSYFNIEKYYRSNKFVDLGSAEFNYITDYVTSEKIDHLIFSNEKAVAAVDMIYKTNSKSNKEYLKLNQGIIKSKKCSQVSCSYECEKTLKNNKMKVESFYKTTNIQWMKQLVQDVSKKIRQR